MESRERIGSRTRERARRLVLSALFFLLAITGGVLSVWALGRSNYSWHGFLIETRLAPATTGQTRIRLAPLGEIQARTHAMPVALIASLEAIDVDELKKLVASNPRREELAHELERVGRSDIQNFVLRQLGWGALGGLAAPILMRRRRVRTFLLGSVVGTVAVGAVMASAFSSFDGKAFNSLTYTGTLKATPWVIQFGKDAFTKIEALSTKLRAVAENLNVLYGRIAALPLGLDAAGPGETIRILHISDLHNNLAALDFVREVATQFKIDFIVDTGDLTDFGSPPELLMVQNIGKLPYPYVFVLGNHDSQAVSAAMTRTPNVTILNGQTVTIKNISILGIANPASSRAGAGSVDTTPQELATGGEALLQAWNALSEKPDIVALHDPEESRPLWGRAPLILCGHEHRIYLQTEGNPAGGSATPLVGGVTTILSNAGTTGAAGLRYFEKEKGVPFSCAVVTLFRAAQPGSAVSAGTSANSAGGASSASGAAKASNRMLPAGSAGTTGVSGSPATVTASPVTSAPAHWQLRAIDQIVLDGTLGTYSVSHHTYNNPPPIPSAVSPMPAPATPLSRPAP